MKNKLENIDELFKKTFDGFEADVDPSVWANVQSSIGTSGASAAAAASVKSIVLKIIAGVIALGAIATGAYLFSESTNSDEVEVLVNIPLQENVIKGRTEVFENKEAQVVDNVFVDEVREVKNKPVEELTKTIVVENSDDVPSLVMDKVSEAVNDVVSEANSSGPIAAALKSENSNEIEKSTDIKTEEIKEMVAIISSDNKVGKAPLDVAFDVDGENIVSYFWDFKDGSEASNNSNPIHTFSYPGTYNVVLTIVDENANAKQISYQIQVERNNAGFLNREKVSRVITPNGDGIQDVIRIDGENIQHFNATVISSSTRKVIYEWNSLEGFWDGKNMAGDNVPKGTYFIQVTAIGEDGKPVKPIKQSVTLY